jgi:hypothetical protein
MAARRAILPCVGIVLAAATAHAAEYHVDGAAAGGGDGSAEKPWQSLQQGIDALSAPGDTLVVHAGTYDVVGSLKVSDKHGSETGPITIRAEGEVTLDGNDSASGLWGGLVDVRKSEWIVVKGFRIEDAGFFGVFFESTDHCTAEGNFTNRTNGSGVASWNSKNLTVRGNDVQSCCNKGAMGSGTGCQECISLDHVDGFLIEGNLVHDSQQQGLANWGGGEGIDVKNGSSNGVVRDNEVRNVVQLGIYVDAWEADISNVEIYGNRVHGNANGIILTSEQTGGLTNIRVHDNLSYDNGFDGIGISSYAPANPTFKDIQIFNNTVVHNGYPENKPYFLPSDQRNATWGRGIAVAEPDIEGLVIRDNISFANGADQLTVDSGVPSPTLEHNLVGPTLNGGISGQNGIETADVGFADLAGRDLSLFAGSPAIDAGLGGPNLGLTDFWGNVRLAGSAVDIGAFEFGSKPPTGSGGAAGSGGSGASAGSGGVPTTGGAGGSAGSNATPSGSDDGGCGCRATRSPADDLSLLGLGLLAIWWRRRRTGTAGISS